MSMAAQITALKTKRAKALEELRTVTTKMEAGDHPAAEDIQEARRIHLDISNDDDKSLGLDQQIKMLQDLNGFSEARNAENRGTREVLNETADLDPEKASRSEVLASPEYRSAFYKSLVGEKLTDIERRALGTDAGTAGATLYTTFQNKLIEKIDELSIISSLATKITTPDGNDLQWIKEGNQPTAAWTAEAAPWHETSASFGSAKISAYDLTAWLAINKKLIRDGLLDIVEGYSYNRLARSIAALKDSAYVNGNGGADYVADPINNDQTSPVGFLNKVQVGIQLATGQAASVSTDDLIRLQHTIHPTLRAGSSFVVSDKTVMALRLLKDGEGRYIWQDDLTAGVQSRLLGTPVGIETNMPDLGANNRSVAYGNFAEALLIRDVQDVKVTRLDEIRHLKPARSLSQPMRPPTSLSSVTTRSRFSRTRLPKQLRERRRRYVGAAPLCFTTTFRRDAMSQKTTKVRFNISLAGADAESAFQAGQEYDVPSEIAEALCASHDGQPPRATLVDSSTTPEAPADPDAEPVAPVETAAVEAPENAAAPTGRRGRTANA